jgi:hypothetical protein
MIDIRIDGLSRLQAYVTELESRLTDRTRLFSDFIAPLVAGEIAEIFEDDNDIQAATSTSHPGNIAHFGPSEMIWGFEAAYGENYPERHKTGEGLPARPVFELITVGGRLGENIEKLTEKWAREEIAEAERRLS